MSCLCYSLISLSTATKPETDLQSMPAVIKAVYWAGCSISAKDSLSGHCGIDCCGWSKRPKRLEPSPKPSNQFAIPPFSMSRSKIKPHFPRTSFKYCACIYIRSVRSTVWMKAFGHVKVLTLFALAFHKWFQHNYIKALLVLVLCPTTHWRLAMSLLHLYWINTAITTLKSGNIHKILWSKRLIWVNDVKSA